MYLNGYIPGLQCPGGVAWFLRERRGARFASSMLLDPISRDFEREIEQFTKRHGVPVHRFLKGERKDLETQARLHSFAKPEGVLYLGTAQEKMGDDPHGEAAEPGYGRGVCVAGQGDGRGEGVLLVPRR